MNAPHILTITFGAFCTVTLATTSPALIIGCIASLIGAVMTAHRDKEEEKKGK